MAKYRINIKKIEAFKKRVKTLQAPVDKRTAALVGSGVLKEMKSLISKGISTVRGNYPTRYPRYKDKKKYPGKRKAAKPVNLKLTGQMLRSLKYKLIKLKGGYSTEVKYIGSLANKKESGHREGVNTQPKRPTIPSRREGETFAARIDKLVRGLYNNRIKDLTKKKL